MLLLIQCPLKLYQTLFEVWQTKIGRLLRNLLKSVRYRLDLSCDIFAAVVALKHLGVTRDGVRKNVYCVPFIFNKLADCFSRATTKRKMKKLFIYLSI